MTSDSGDEKIKFKSILLNAICKAKVVFLYA